jgi:UDP-N-acetylglucosamine acyltransferase
VTIHPQAVVSPHATLGRDVEIGPFSVVESQVTIGDRCRLESHVLVKQGTVLGADNHLHDGAVIGGLPQHVHAPQRPGPVLIGDGNTIREHCTVHRAMSETSATRIGSHNYLMVGSHVAHDCVVGDHVILANGVLLGGHVQVEDRAYMGGAAAVHQFCRIGRNAMVGGHARLLKDVPPFVLIDGATAMVVGLNLVGLRRAGFGPEDIEQLKAAYRLIYRRGLTWKEVLESLRREFPEGAPAEFLRFFSGGSRGFAQERRMPPQATLKLHRQDEADPQLDRKVG